MKAGIGMVFPRRRRSAGADQAVKPPKVNPKPKRTRSVALRKAFPKRSRSAGVNNVES